MSSQNISQFLGAITSQTPKSNLIAGTENKDDAAAVRINDQQILLSTTDFFTPIVDNPEDFGYIAAANAVSDIYAMGGKPILAISVLGWPTSKLPISVLKRVLSGALDLCNDVNMPLGGGHSIENSEPIFGLSVNGLIENGKVFNNKCARPGDLIYLTKNIGTGILATALKKNIITDEDYDSLLKSLRTVNSVGYLLSKSDYLHTMTDVTGFGLLGHLTEVCTASKVSANINFQKLKPLADLTEYVNQGCVPGGLNRNKESFELEASNLPPAHSEMLFDPQTNGGLLLFVNPQGSQAIEKILTANGINNTEPIGEVTDRKESLINIV